eukprot:m.195897 g.195897  ORF g.195897 m.195897 type:complete len:618 (-) comp17007_c0_seq6:1033-2886(-)
MYHKGNAMVVLSSTMKLCLSSVAMKLLQALILLSISSSHDGCEQVSMVQSDLGNTVVTTLFWASFANDGSFMARFKAQQAQAQASQQKSSVPLVNDGNFMKRFQQQQDESPSQVKEQLVESKTAKRPANVVKFTMKAKPKKKKNTLSSAADDDEAPQPAVDSPDLNIAGMDLSSTIARVAAQVGRHGDSLMNTICQQDPNNAILKHIFDPDTAAYAQFRAQVTLVRQAADSVTKSPAETGVVPQAQSPAKPTSRRNRFDQPGPDHSTSTPRPTPSQASHTPATSAPPQASTQHTSTIRQTTSSSSTAPSSDLASALEAAKAKAALLAKQVAAQPSQAPKRVSLMVRVPEERLTVLTNPDQGGLSRFMQRFGVDVQLAATPVPGTNVRLISIIGLQTPAEACQAELLRVLQYGSTVAEAADGNLITAEEIQRKLNGKPQYSYDSDEDIDDQGTWEHKKRAAEMKKTALQAQALTQAGHDKHHLADFLPQAELEKFLDPAAAAQRKQTANQLTQSNLGFQMLQKAGWNQGQGLGVAGQGMTVPVASNGAGAGHAGLGTTDPTVSKIVECGGAPSAFMWCSLGCGAKCVSFVLRRRVRVYRVDVLQELYRCNHLCIQNAA